jgi:hypothetical protein
MTHQQWYVHILGPDDVEGPMTVDAAFRRAAEVNSGMDDRFGALTDDSFTIWAVPTRSERGTTDYRPADPSVQPPTREQIAEVAEDAYYQARDNGWSRWPNVGDAVLALFPQPTPSAEPVDEDVDDEESCARCYAGVDSSEHHEKCVLTGHAHDGESAPAEPVSIADMAPGAMDGPVYRCSECGRMLEDSHTPTCAWFDPPTIRDVTPPPATAEEGDRG